MDIIDKKKARRMFFKKFMVVLGVFGALASIFGICFHSLLENQWILCIYIIVIVFLIVCISFFLFVNELFKRELVYMTEHDIPDVLLKIVEKLKPTVSDVLSDGVDRFFQIEGYVDKRINLGEILIKNPKKETQVKVLIDNYGWALYLHNNVELAISNIEEGVKMAEEHHFYYWAAKGERHLSGIEWHRGNEEASFKHLEKAKHFTEEIQNGNIIEMEGSLHLTEAKYNLRKSLTENDSSEKNRLLEAAKTHANSAMNKLEIDNLRQIKVYAVLGNIYFEKRDWTNANIQFMEGMKNSENVCDDEFARNAFGLAKLYYTAPAPYGNLKTSKEYLTKADSHKTSLYPNERAEIESMLRKIGAI